LGLFLSEKVGGEKKKSFVHQAKRKERSSSWDCENNKH